MPPQSEQAIATMELLNFDLHVVKRRHVARKAPSGTRDDKVEVSPHAANQFMVAFGHDAISEFAPDRGDAGVRRYVATTFTCMPRWKILIEIKM
jgi:hypothetical protein